MKADYSVISLTRQPRDFFIFTSLHSNLTSSCALNHWWRNNSDDDARYAKRTI